MHKDAKILSELLNIDDGAWWSKKEKVPSKVMGAIKGIHSLMLYNAFIWRLHLVNGVYYITLYQGINPVEGEAVPAGKVMVRGIHLPIGTNVKIYSRCYELLMSIEEEWGINATDVYWYQGAKGNVKFFEGSAYKSALVIS